MLRQIPFFVPHILLHIRLHIETLLSFQKVISRMKNEDGIEAIVLGCTELPLLLNDEVSSVPCLDTMQIHINAIINTILDRDLEDVVTFSNIIEENICKF